MKLRNLFIIILSLSLSAGKLLGTESASKLFSFYKTPIGSDFESRWRYLNRQGKAFFRGQPNLYEEKKFLNKLQKAIAAAFEGKKLGKKKKSTVETYILLRSQSLQELRDKAKEGGIHKRRYTFNLNKAVHDFLYKSDEFKANWITSSSGVASDVSSPFLVQNKPAQVHAEYRKTEKSLQTISEESEDSACDNSECGESEGSVGGTASAA